MRSDHGWPGSSVLMLTCLLTGCLDPIPPETLTGPGEGAIRGSVKDYCTRSGLPGVLVTPRPLLEGTLGRPGSSTVTDPGGEFQLGHLQPGNWQLLFSLKGYQPSEKTVSVSSGSAQLVEVGLPPVPTKLPSEAKLDVLFVVDNSNSMAEEQRGLTAAFPGFLDTLLSLRFSLDLRVGVISTNLGAGNFSFSTCEVPGGDGGKLQVTPRIPGCQPPRDPYLSLIGGTSNVPGDMVNDAFACIATLGTGGCGFEQPLAAIRRAIDGVTNPGFPRPEAALAIVVISDEDDCSAADTALFDPSQQGLSDPLGPLSSFRCFEFGVSCDVGGRTPGPRHSCRPSSGGYLLDPTLFVAELLKGRNADRVFFSVLAGPLQPVEVGLDGSAPTLKASCHSTATGQAAPAIRLAAVVDQLAPSSSLDTICQGDLGATLRSIARQIAEKVLLAPCP